MIIKFNSITGQVIATYPEAYQFTDPKIGFIQVVEDGKVKYKPNDIRTHVIDGKVAKNYEDPRKPNFDINKCRIDVQGNLCDDKNKISFNKKGDKIAFVPK